MDVQKTLAQAEQFLKRGKTEDAAQKFLEVLQHDPQNEVAANKLALIYIDLGDTEKAIQIYCEIAKRASERGKNQKALALYKQALGLGTSNPNVLIGIAEESEQLGKFSDAAKYSEELINYFLPRKRYLDLIETCARLVRCQPDNERAKIIWLEVIKVLVDENKLARALVVFCGPPGLSTHEQQIGGDPQKIGQAVLTQLVALQDWFVMDPSLPYSLAWVAYRNGNKKSAYRFLFEAFRRDPDYCLTLLLFARLLIEEGKLLEGQFIFAYVNEALQRDQRVKIKILNEQIASFEKSNGWMAFNEGLTTDKLSGSDFIKKIHGEEIEEKKEENTKSFGQKSIANNLTPDREINLTPLNEIVENDQKSSAATIENDFEATMVFSKPEDVTSKKEEFTSGGGQSLSIDFSASGSRLDDGGEFKGGNPTPPPPPPKIKLPKAIVPTPKKTFDDVLSGIEKPVVELIEKKLDTPEKTSTEIFSPQDLVNASKWEKASNLEVHEKSRVIAREEKEAIEAHKEKNIKELVANEGISEENSNKKVDNESGLIGGIRRMINIARPKINADDANSRILTTDFLEDEKTNIFSSKKEDEQKSTDLLALDAPNESGLEIEVDKSPGSSGEIEKSEPEQKQIHRTVGYENKLESDEPTHLIPFRFDTKKIEKAIEDRAAEMLQRPSEAIQEVKPFDEDNEPTIVFKKSVKETVIKKNEVAFQDRGSDLIITNNEQSERIDEAVSKDSDRLILLAKELLTDKKYVLARKKCREALGMGADIEAVNELLQKIRDLERPESFFKQASSDSNKPIVSAEKIINDLEIDYSLGLDDNNPDMSMRESVKRLRSDIEDQLKEADPRLRIDLGIAFLQMGFLEEAENLFLIAMDDTDLNFEASYLAAQTMSSRGSHASAAEILLSLLSESLDQKKKDLVPVYYLLGEVNEALKNMVESKKFYLKASEIDQNFRDLKAKLGE